MSTRCSGGRFLSVSVSRSISAPGASELIALRKGVDFRTNSRRRTKSHWSNLPLSMTCSSRYTSSAVVSTGICEPDDRTNLLVMWYDVYGEKRGPAAPGLRPQSRRSTA
jgi:hypothetical protein